MPNSTGNKTLILLIVFLLIPLFTTKAISSNLPTEKKTPPISAATLFKNGNYKDAFRLFKIKLLQNKIFSPTAFNNAITALQHLNRHQETDQFIKDVLKIHNHNYQAYWLTSNLYADKLQHTGYILGNKFYRGYTRNYTTRVDTRKLDHLYALKYMQEAKKLLLKSTAENTLKAKFYYEFAKLYIQDINCHNATELLVKSNLNHLPKYTETINNSNIFSQGSPVTLDNKPVFFKLPYSEKQAKNNGELFRWYLHQASIYTGNDKNEKIILAELAQRLYGIETITSSYPFTNSPEKVPANSPLTKLDKLKENQTIARLANGIHKFTLPPEYAYLQIYTDLTANTNGSNYARKTAELYSQRNQFSTAAKYWKKYLNIPDLNFNDKKYAEKQLQQITDSFIKFTTSANQPAKQPLKFTLLYRNTDSVKITVQKIKLNKIIDDTINYIKSADNILNNKMLEIEDLGWRIIHKNQNKYIQKEIINKEISLKNNKSPIPHATNKKEIILTEKLPAGAYLLTATLENGYTCYTILWLSELAIFNNYLNNNTELFFTSNASTGIIMPNTKIRIFGFPHNIRFNNNDKQKNLFERVAKTDNNGCLLIEDLPTDYSYIISAQDDNNNLAYLGITSLFKPYSYNKQNNTKIFYVTDKPLYKPGEKIEISGILRTQNNIKNKHENSQTYNSLTLNLYNPKSEKIASRQVKPDNNGKFSFIYQSKDNDILGSWHLSTDKTNINETGNYFSIEKYKKPEYTVKIIPPHKIPAINKNFDINFKAEYLFGSPLQNACIDYTITCSIKEISPYNTGKWDWLYGKGYNERTLHKITRFYYPCPLPPFNSSELISEGRIYTDKSGNASININPPHQQQINEAEAYEYHITATTRDSNNNIINSSSAFTINNNEFTLISTLNKNFYSTGETVKASFSRKEHTDNNNITNNCLTNPIVKLYKLSAKDSETLINEKRFSNNNSKNLKYEFKTESSGLHRIEFQATDSFGNTIKTDKVFFIIPDKPEKLYINQPLLIIPEYNIYQPNDKVKILILSKKENSNALLLAQNKFESRITTTSNNYCLTEYQLTSENIPNTFITGFINTDANLHKESAEIFIPPVTKILDLNIKSVQKEYLPSEKAKLKIQVKDPNGIPFTGNAIVTVYDQAIDQLLTNNPYPSIKDFFWGYINNNNSRYLSSLQKFSYNLYKKDTIPMERLSPFDTFLNDSIPVSYELMRKGGGINRMAVADSTSEIMSTATPSAENFSNKNQDNFIRENFSTTALFTDKINFNKNGEAEIELNLPDNLTTWQVRLWAVTSETAVNQAETQFITSKNIVVIPNIPRFLIKGDTSAVYTTIYNNSNKKIIISPEFSVTDNLKIVNYKKKEITISPNSTKNINYNIKARLTGEAVLKFSAGNSELHDGVKLTLPVLKNTQVIYKSQTGIIPPETQKHTINFNLPKYSNHRTAKFKFALYPDLSTLIIDTANFTDKNFCSTNDSIINKILTELYIQKIKKPLKNDKEYSKYKIQQKFDLATQKLAQLQLPDGGWSWIGKNYYSSPYITASILYSLEKARKLGINIPAIIITNARLYLLDYQNKQLVRLYKSSPQNSDFKKYADNLDALIYTTLTAGENENPNMRKLLFRDRLNLSVYSLCLLAEGLLEANDILLFKQVMENISQYLITDNENNTAFLEYNNSSCWWQWYGSELEALAKYLKLRLQNHQENIINTAITHYLLNHIKHNNSWGSARRAETIISALSEYISTQPLQKTTGNLSISLNHNKTQQYSISNNNSQTIKTSYPYQQILPGNNSLTITSNYSNHIYYSSNLIFENQANKIKAEGKEIKILRKYYLLRPETITENQPDPLGGIKKIKKISYKKVELKDHDIIHTGDLIETEIIITSKNDYRYIKLFEKKPAAFETQENRSGYKYSGITYYTEFKNDSINYYIARLPRGTHTISYRSYSIFNGRFSAMPAISTGVYALELNSNSAEFKFSIAENH